MNLTNETKRKKIKPRGKHSKKRGRSRAKKRLDKKIRMMREEIVRVTMIRESTSRTMMTCIEEDMIMTRDQIALKLSSLMGTAVETEMLNMEDDK